MHMLCTPLQVAIGLITANLVLSYPIVLNPPERALETTQGSSLRSPPSEAPPESLAPAPPQGAPGDPGRLGNPESI